MSNQRSILSFFSNAGASSQPPKPTLPQASKQTGPPPPPPPPPSSRFVPPPPPRNGYALPPGAASSSASSASLSSTRHTPPPQPVLPAITPDQSRAILLQAGAVVDSDDDSLLVFPQPLAPPSSACRIVYPRAQHIPGLVSVNAILLPVRYQDNFYHAVADPTRYASLFNRVILDADNKVVGGIAGRLEESPFSSPASPASQAAAPQPQLAVYIQSLALSSPYRGSGLMAAALQSILKTVDVLNAAAPTDGTDGTPGLGAAITAVYCHVWTESDDALRWYEANGFRRDAPEPLANYYFKLQPNTAWVVRRDVARPSVLEAVRAAKAGPSQPQPQPQPPSQSQSYQNSRPQTEWNDLPADMVTASGAPSVAASGPVSTAASAAVSAAGSAASSRNVSRVNLAEAPSDDSLLPPPPPPPTGGSLKTSGTTRKKRERAYPAAMFQ